VWLRWKTTGRRGCTLLITWQGDTRS
jgi:hypothetical protein